MKIGIDASNISAGGGLTHLIELLRSADPQRHGFDTLVLWAARRTLARLDDRHWLDKRHEAVLDAGFVRRGLWQRNRLGAALREAGCDVLFVPGGSFATPFQPTVTMSRNLLPFEMRELLRYGWSAATLKMLALRYTQSRSYRHAAGTIFLTQYARQAVQAVTGPLPGAVSVIPHGVDRDFLQAPRPQRPLAELSPERPFRWLYVSSIDHYKHPWHVAEAVAQLQRRGLPVAVDFIGSGASAPVARLRRTIARCDPDGRFLRYLGGVDHRALPGYYADADGFAYASSCENLPNILLEAMAAGLPIACSSLGPMPEVLGEAGDYFDPVDVDSIATTLERQLLDAPHRARIAGLAHAAAQRYTWSACADRTFAFLKCAAESGRGARPT